MKRSLSQGFTLIELMVTVVIVAVIAAVALPSYQSQVRKSRRAAVVAAASVIQQAEERWRANHTSYTDVLNSTGLNLPLNGANQYESSGGYYTLAVSNVNGSRYVITATAVSGTSQASDSAGGTSCSTLTISVSGGNAINTPTACWSK